LKTAGREAGKYCVVLKKMDENFVLITGPKAATKVKRRRCNIEHLEPLTHKIKIAAEASDSEVLKAFEKETIYTKLEIEKPDLSAIKKMKEEKAKRKAEAKPRPEKKERSKPEKVKTPKEKPKAKKPEKKAKPKPAKKRTEKKPKAKKK